MRTRLSGIALAGLIAAFGIAACGGSDDDGKKESPSKGSSGSKSNADEVGCGTKICKPAEGFTGQMCCRAAFESKCGQMIAGTCTDLPPAADKRCPSSSFSIANNMVMVPSCCNTTNNECGLIFNAGIGAPMCTTLTMAKSVGQRFMTMGAGGMMMFNFTGNIPDPVTCDGKPVEAMSGAAGGGS